MPIATHTLTGDLLPVLGGVEWDSVTAWLECEPFADFVQDPGTGTLMPDRRLPFDVAADGSFSVVVPDSAQAGLSYRLNAQPSLAGRRLAGKRSDPFTVASSGRWDEMPFTPPDIPEAVRLAALTDAAVAALLADPGSLTFAAGGRGRWPVVQIDTGGVAVDSKETYVPGTYTITDTDGGVVHSGALNIKGRGNTTWNQPKKPYRLQLASKTALLGMSASQKNWALLANYLDHAKVNTHLAYTLGARLSGLTWTPQYRVVEVVLNGDYLGLYQLCDLVRMESGRLDEDPPDADTGSGLTGTYLLEADNKEQPGYPGESDDPGWATSRPVDHLRRPCRGRPHRRADRLHPGLHRRLRDRPLRHRLRRPRHRLAGLGRRGILRRLVHRPRIVRQLRLRALVVVQDVEGPRRQAAHGAAVGLRPLPG